MGHIIVRLSMFVQALDVFLSFMKINQYGAAECCALHIGCFLCARMLLFHILGDLCWYYFFEFGICSELPF